MFSSYSLIISISLMVIFVVGIVDARYGYYNQGYRTNAPQQQPRQQQYYNYSNRQGYYGNRQGGYYQGYSNRGGYQGYGQNNYRNYYYPQQQQQFAQQYAQPAPPKFQPSLADLLFGGMRQQPSYSSGGINYDSYGNSFVGTKENGIYLFCNGKGCPGRG